MGHRFRTRSDTEVILHAFEEWAEGAFERFNGQFAIALWDESRETLVLARDRLGVRPLYLCEHDGRLWFASEVKALFAGDRSIPRQVDPVGLAETFTFWSTVPPQTVFEGITELEPGHLKIVTPSSTTDVAFWSPQYPVDAASTFQGSLDEAVDETRAALANAVSLRMLRADVPVGCYLSGGLDSSLIAAMARRATGHGFLTFSIRFDDPEYDETRFQRTMAERLDSHHNELVVTRRDIADAFPAVVTHAERPLLRTAPAALYLLSEAVRGAGVKVVLTGEGADEMFAGYDLFREAKVRRFWGRAPGSELRPLLLERLYPYLSRSPVARRTMAREYFGRDREHWAEPGFSHRPRWRSTSALNRLFAPRVRLVAERANVDQRLLESRPPDFDRWSALAQDQYLEMRTLLTGISCIAGRPHADGPREGQTKNPQRAPRRETRPCPDRPSRGEQWPASTSGAIGSTGLSLGSRTGPGGGQPARYSACLRRVCASSQSGRTWTSDCSSRVRRTSIDGRPCRRISTWRFARS